MTGWQIELWKCHHIYGCKRTGRVYWKWCAFLYLFIFLISGLIEQTLCNRRSCSERKTLYLLKIDPRIDSNEGQSSGHFLSLRYMKKADAFRVWSLWVIHFFLWSSWGPSPQFGGKGFIYLVLVVTMTVNTDTWLLEGHSLIYSTAYGVLSVCVYERK